MDVMTTPDIVGDIVQVVLREPEALAAIGLNRRNVFLEVVGLDEIGLWVAHPGYVLVKAEDKAGKPLPEPEQVRTQLEANFLLRWELISTIVHFPHREGYDFPSPFEKHIGFIAEEAEKESSAGEEKNL